MNNNDNHKTLQTQIVAQWITSLAISVICCAILFIVFAGYIVQLHETTNLLTIKVELLQERNTQLSNEMTMMRKGPVVQINGVAPGTLTVTPQANVITTPPAPDAQPPQMPAPAMVQPAATPQPVPTPPAPEKNEIVLPAEELAPDDVVVPEPKKETAPKTKAKE